ncbi:hypothetical protein SAMN04488082_11112 [Desulfomicrobium apsheronum]|uniref:Uncharacterized protein n=1 Tax=Desulfomicrobium apsheronum TaxID=52560 RepID=A0A1I3VUG8_9BACT|nr:hypothetical protein [Desulfomicrobium apsheronum]SFJ97916.1 hypothetical protein SAMN04488082_11112 [Desulfomicrobium apsheronum]
MSFWYLADTFFEQPNARKFAELRAATEKLGYWETVRMCLLDHLTTGNRPDIPGKDTASLWPLPQPEVSWPLVKNRNWRRQFPDFSLLIEIAIQENRLEDAIRLNIERPRDAYSSMSLDLTVAHAVSPQAIRRWPWTAGAGKPRASLPRSSPRPTRRRPNT